MKYLTSLFLLVFGVGFLSACSHDRAQEINVMVEDSGEATPLPADSPDQSPEAMMKKEAVVVLEEQSGLGQSGTAVLTENADGQVVVTLTMVGSAFAQPQPAHIHAGSCPNPGAVTYPLTNVVSGSSVTTLDMTLDELMSTEGDMAINVHRSEADVKTYTACGDIEKL